MRKGGNGVLTLISSKLDGVSLAVTKEGPLEVALYVEYPSTDMIGVPGIDSHFPGWKRKSVGNHQQMPSLAATCR
jgi:hypothetical protein